MNRDVLITGFGPFPHVRVNPTAGLAVTAARRSGGRSLVLETSYGRGLADLAQALTATRPAAVLMLGVAARSRWIRVEMLARRGSSPLSVDAGGKTPEPETGSGIPAPALPLRTSASGQIALATLARHGLRTRLSASAGRYLCNASYALALAHAARSGIPVIFIHVPMPRPAAGLRRAAAVAPFRPARDTLAVALAEIARGLGRQARSSRARMTRTGMA